MGRHTGRVLAVAAVAVVVAVLAGQMVDLPVTGDAIERRQVAIGETVPLSATISNPLSVPDALMVSFSGPAVEQENVDIELPANSSTFTCYEGRETCNIRIGAGGNADVEFGLSGVEPGRAPLRVTVASTTTDKEAEARMFLIVTGETVPGAFVDALNGIF